MHQRTPPPSLLCSFRQLTTGDDHLNQKTGTVVGVKRNHRENTCSNQPAAGRAKNILYVCQDIPVSWWPKARTHGPTELPAHFCRKYGRQGPGAREGSAHIIIFFHDFVFNLVAKPCSAFFFGRWLRSFLKELLQHYVRVRSAFQTPPPKGAKMSRLHLLLDAST